MNNNFLNSNSRTSALRLRVMGIALAAMLCFCFSNAASANKKKKANLASSQSQGLSLEEAKAISDRHWLPTVSTGLRQGLDEMDELFSISTFDLTYKFNPKLLAGALVGHLAPTDQEDVNPEQYGLTDTTFYLSRPAFFRSKDNGRLSYSGNLTVPTSRESRRIGFVGQLTNSLTYSKNLSKYPRVTLTGVSSMSAAHFRYEESRTGDVVYSPLGLAVGANVNIRLMNKLFWSTTFLANNQLNYEEKIRVTQTISSNLSLVATGHILVSLGYRWRDRLESNHRVLDDDRSRVSLGVAYNF